MLLASEKLPSPADNNELFRRSALVPAVSKAPADGKRKDYIRSLA
jgi:hypothetical protein